MCPPTANLNTPSSEGGNHHQKLLLECAQAFVATDEVVANSVKKTVKATTAGARHSHHGPVNSSASS